jgi:hypothetical protein
MNVSRQIGWSNESNLLYQILKQITKLTAVIFSLKPKYKVFTALLTQTGPSDELLLSSGAVTIGVTYRISDASDGDFSNVGAPNNEASTYFIAINNEVPNSYGSAQLIYNPGAPTAIILENTIGNIRFTYLTFGEYTVNSNNLFIEDKTAVDIDAFSYANILSYSFISNETIFPENMININSQLSGGPSDSILAKNRIEIRVYN